MRIGYVSGAYSAVTPEQVQANIDAADAVGRELLAKGYCPIVPHKNSAGWENDARFLWQDFIDADLALLAKCDFVVMVGDWIKSKGAIIEVEFAREHGIPVYADVSLLEDVNEPI
jgi:nucleoside 2-deoxyribosyltransferase